MVWFWCGLVNMIVCNLRCDGRFAFLWRWGLSAVVECYRGRGVVVVRSAAFNCIVFEMVPGWSLVMSSSSLRYINAYSTYARRGCTGMFEFPHAYTYMYMMKTFRCGTTAPCFCCCGRTGRTQLDPNPHEPTRTAKS